MATRGTLLLLLAAQPLAAFANNGGELAAGDGFTCALVPEGDVDRVKCWGVNTAGELGVGDTESRGSQRDHMGAALPYLDLAMEGSIREVAVGTIEEGFGCALSEAGQVKCWGALNGAGRLGTGSTDGHGGSPGSMGENLPAVDLGTDARAVAIGAGASTACALLEDGLIKCWGAVSRLGLNLLAQGEFKHPVLGSGVGDAPGELGDNLTAVDLGEGVRAKSLAVGTSHSCAVTTTGGVKCWGPNPSGALGYGDTLARGVFADADDMGDNLPYVDLGEGVLAVQVTIGLETTCAVLADGGVKCWGSNYDGSLGYGDNLYRGDKPGTMGDNLPYVDLGTRERAVSMSSHEYSHCVVLCTGSVKCFGMNQYYHLGYPFRGPVGNKPGDMGDNLPAVDLADKAVAVAMGTRHTCVKLARGDVQCFGHNWAGQLGRGDTVTPIGRSATDMGRNLRSVLLRGLVLAGLSPEKSQPAQPEPAATMTGFSGATVAAACGASAVAGAAVAAALLLVLHRRRRKEPELVLDAKADVEAAL